MDDGQGPAHSLQPRRAPGQLPARPEHWASASLSKNAAGTPRPTSALCQPAVHAIAALRIFKVARGTADEDEARTFLAATYGRLLRWHRYLATSRDPEGSGLVTIYHPWESGTDNSPRWDGALANVEVGEMPPYARPDLGFVDEPSERPSAAEYDRYLWLVELLKRARYDEAEFYGSHPFLVKDVLSSAILVAANEALLEIAGIVEAPDADREEIGRRIRRGREGLDACYDRDLGLCLDRDLRVDEPLRVRTIAGFAPLISGCADPRREELLRLLFSEGFAGHAGFRWPLPPSTSPEEARFHPRAYWRGPVWPVISWLLWRSLKRSGEKERAADLERFSLEQLSAGGFAEYFEPFTGEPLGSDDQSWTAAVALDWLAGDP